MGQRLAPHPRLQTADEVPLVGKILPSLERADAGAELQHRRHRTDSAERRGRRVAVVARKFERQIAAQGVAGNDDRSIPSADDSWMTRSASWVRPEW